MVIRPLTNAFPKAIINPTPLFQSPCASCADLCGKLLEQHKDGQLKTWSKKYDVQIYQDKDGNAIAIAVFDNAGDPAALAFKYDKAGGGFGYNGVAGNRDLFMYNDTAPLEQYARAKAWLLLNPKAKGEEKKKREEIVRAKEAEGFKTTTGCIDLNNSQTKIGNTEVKSYVR